VLYDGAVSRTIAPEDGWQIIALPKTFQPQVHLIALNAESPFLLDSVTITNDFTRSLLPMILAGGSVVVLVIGVLLAALWRRLQ
jgi:hypothetical protein